MIELDGPATAYFEESDGTRHIYHSYAYKSKNAGDLVHMYGKWRDRLKGTMLVWRQRPTIKQEVYDDTEKWWTIYFRCCVVPWIDYDAKEVPMKPEGAPIGGN